MATRAEWIEGARPRTLPAAAAPVLSGTAVALAEGKADFVLFLLAAVVALALQIGVNYANDYSDGIRGTDEQRVGPQRLVGSGAAQPRQVKMAAFACFGVAAVAGLIIVIITGHWWLLAVGAAAIAAAWFYTGGKHPYGYAGWGEFFVFIFFGLVAVGGTTYIQVGRVPMAAWLAAIAMGALSCAVLTANNLRDLENDRRVGKHTLPTRLGDLHTRSFFTVLIATALMALAASGLLISVVSLASLASAALLVPAAAYVLQGVRGLDLVRVLRNVGLGQLIASLGLLVGAF